MESPPARVGHERRRVEPDTTEEEDMRSQWVAIVLGLTLVIAATVTAPAASERQAAAGSTDFQQGFPLVSTSVPCPADVPPNTTECRALSVQTYDPVQGLSVSESTYTLPLALGPPTCPAGLGKPLATTGRRSILAGKGEIAFALSEGARCVDSDEAWEEPQEFTITGGTGPFAAASGRGTVVRADFGFDYGETWTGTLTAPGLHLTAPKLSGAVAKTVRAAKGAKSARVTFEVTATDDEGGDIDVSCEPPSGSRFPLGRTTVRCWATDSSGNTAFAPFTVTVKRRR
jgi:HYR domain